MAIQSALLVIAIILFLVFTNTLLRGYFLHNTYPNSPIVRNNSYTINPIEQECSQENNSYIPPVGKSMAAERIRWFMTKLPELEIFRENEKTSQFEERTRQFFGSDCDGQFFMTWLAPGGRFGPRAFKALESVFNAHPRACLVILSTSLDSECGSRMLKPLVDRGHKVVALTPDMNFLFKNLPAEIWYDEIKTGKKDPGEIPIGQNLSNLMRLAVVYKFGGIYLDTDYIVLKNLSGLRNSIGAQAIYDSGKWMTINNALLIFDKGHPLVYKFIEEFASTFDGSIWAHNGPEMVSRVVRRVEIDPDPGFKYTILRTNEVYPVDWVGIPSYFEKPYNESHSQWIDTELRKLKEQAYGLHLWNKESGKLRIEEGSVVDRLISDHCVVCESNFAK